MIFMSVYTNKNRTQGFTLIELMITVAIISIIAAIAVPSYQASIRKSKRSEAMAALTDIASLQEQHYVQYNSYAQYLTKKNGGLNYVNHQNENKVFTDNGNYKLVLSWPFNNCSVKNRVCFQVTAIAQGSQAKDEQCNKFILRSDGLKIARDISNAKSDCW